MKPHTSSVRGGLLWSLSSRVGSQALQLAFSIALARILSPAEFGTIGMLLVFSGFAQLIADSGLTSALIHKQDLREVDQSTVFWLQMAAAVALTAIFFATGGALAEFFRDPQLKELSRAMSLVFTIQALGLVHGAMLRRQFRFRFLGFASIAASAVSGVIAVALAILGFGVWALLWQILSYTAVTTVLMWAGLRWMPKFRFSGEAASELGRYGLYLLGHTALNYWLRNGANLIVGRYLGSVDLGIYSRANSLMLLPINNISAVFGQVMFPALARTQDDKREFQALYIKALRLIAFASFPLMAEVGLLSREVVTILFGDRWLPMVPILQILSVVGMFQSIISPVGWIFSALGRTKDQFLLSIFLVVAFAVAMGIGIEGGLLGVTLAYAAWTLLSGLMNIFLSCRVLEMAVYRIFEAVAKITAATAFTAAVAFAVDSTLGAQTAMVAKVLMSTATGALAYLAACWVLREPTLALLGPWLFGFFARRSTEPPESVAT